MLFCVVTWPVVAIHHRRLGTAYRLRVQERKGPIGCPETSVRNYHCWLRNNPEERTSQLHALLHLGQLLDAFRKIAKSDCEHRRVFLCLSAWNSSTLIRRIFMKFHIPVFFFGNLSGKFKFHQSVTLITGILHEGLCTIMIISR